MSNQPHQQLTFDSYWSEVSKHESPMPVSREISGHVVSAMYCTLKAISDLGEVLSEVKRHLAYGRGFDCQKVNRFLTSASIHLEESQDSVNFPLNTSFGPRVYSTESLRIIHALLGVTSEAGELAEPILNPVILGGNEVFNVVNVTEEAGDSLFYLGLLASALGMPMSAVARLNEQKLAKRYDKTGTFSASEALDRDVQSEMKPLVEALAKRRTTP